MWWVRARLMLHLQGELLGYFLLKGNWSTPTEVALQISTVPPWVGLDARSISGQLLLQTKTFLWKTFWSYLSLKLRQRKQLWDFLIGEIFTLLSAYVCQLVCDTSQVSSQQNNSVIPFILCKLLKIFQRRRGSYLLQFLEPLFQHLPFPVILHTELIMVLNGCRGLKGQLVLLHSWRDFRDSGIRTIGE